MYILCSERRNMEYLLLFNKHYKLLNVSFYMPNLLKFSRKVLRGIHCICLILSSEKEKCKRMQNICW